MNCFCRRFKCPVSVENGIWRKLHTESRNCQVISRWFTVAVAYLHSKSWHFHDSAVAAAGRFRHWYELTVFTVIDTGLVTSCLYWYWPRKQARHDNKTINRWYSVVIVIAWSTVVLYLCVCACRGRFSVVRQCVDKQSGAVVAAKYVSRSLVSLDAVMTEVNIMRNLRHMALIQPKCVYDADTAYIIIMPLWVGFSALWLVCISLVLMCHDVLSSP